MKLSLREASLRFGVPHQTLGRWARAGILAAEPQAGPGGPIFVADADVAALARVRVPGAGRNRRRDMLRALAEARL